MKDYQIHLTHISVIPSKIKWAIILIWNRIITGAHLAWANTLNGEEDVYYSYITPVIAGISENQDNQGRLALTISSNPFTDHTTIGFTVGVPGTVKIVVSDIYGRVLQTLVNENKQSGTYHIDWHSDLPAGYYQCRLTSGTQTKTIGLVKVR